MFRVRFFLAFIFCLFLLIGYAPKVFAGPCAYHCSGTLCIPGGNDPPDTCTNNCASCGGGGGGGHSPKGYFDVATCTQLQGWTCDPDNYGAALTVKVYKNGPAGTGVLVGQATANGSRPDVSGECNGTTLHGFSIATFPSLFDGVSHSIYVYGINTGGGSDILLNNSPKTISCAAPTPTKTPTPLPPTRTPTPHPPTATPVPPTATPILGGDVCDSCGWCQNGPTPGNWLSCQRCMYPTLSANTFIATPDPGYAFTVFGCVQTTSGGFTNFFINFATSVIAGLGFLGMLYGAVKVMLARGDPAALVEGKRYIYGSVLAVLVVLFSVFIVKIVGGTILKIPFMQ